MRLFAAVPHPRAGAGRDREAARPACASRGGRCGWCTITGCISPEVLRRGGARAARGDRGGGSRGGAGHRRRCRSAWTSSARFPSSRRPRVIWVGLDAPPALELLQDRLERRGGGDRLRRRRARRSGPTSRSARVREGQRLPPRRAGEPGGAVRAGRRSSPPSWCSTRACSAAGGRATSRGSRWSWPRDGLPHRAVQAARLPRTDRRARAGLALPGPAGARGTPAASSAIQGVVPPSRRAARRQRAGVGQGQGGLAQRLAGRLGGADAVRVRVAGGERHGSPSSAASSTRCRCELLDGEIQVSARLRTARLPRELVGPLGGGAAADGAGRGRRTAAGDPARRGRVGGAVVPDRRLPGARRDGPAPRRPGARRPRADDGAGRRCRQGIRAIRVRPGGATLYGATRS